MTGNQEKISQGIFSIRLKGKNMCALVSGNRGSGKTFLAINLAHALSTMREKTLLFDADNGLYNIKKQLGLSSVEDLDSVIYGIKSLNQIVHSYDKGYFDIICGNPNSAGLLTMSIGRLQILGDDLNLLSQNYKKIILDISSGVTNLSKVLGGISESAIVVCTPKENELVKTYECIRLITSHFSNKRIDILINKVNSLEEGERLYGIIAKTCSLFLNKVPPLLGIVRNDTRVRDSIRNQTTMINRYPESEAAHDVMLIAKRIAENG